MAILMVVEERFVNRIWMWLRFVIGLPIVIFLPGYSLQSALFPKQTDLTKTERLAISFGMSIALFSLVVLVIDRLPWGITEWPIMISLAVCILICFVFTQAARRRLHVDERFIITVHFGWKTSLSEIRGLAKVTIMAMVSSAVLGALFIASMAIVGGSNGEETAFYMLEPEYWAGAASRTFTLNRPAHIGIGIINNEEQDQVFSVLATMDGELIGITGPLELAAGEDWEGVLEFTPFRGDPNQQIEIILTREGDMQPYRELKLIVEVMVSDN